MRYTQFIGKDGRIIEIHEGGHVVGWRPIGKNLSVIAFEAFTTSLDYLKCLATVHDFTDVFTNPLEVFTFDTTWKGAMR